MPIGTCTVYNYVDHHRVILSTLHISITALSEALHSLFSVILAYPAEDIFGSKLALNLGRSE